MIVTRIEALGFRSLRYVSQRLGPFHVLVGPNASGKSAFLDVLAFLGDLQRVGVGQAIAGDAARDVPLRAVDPQHLAWMRRGSTFELAVEVTVPDDLREGLRNAPPEVCRYEVTIDVSEPLRIAVETLWLKPDGGPGPEPARTEFPNPPEPPARIVTDPAKRAPNGWRRVVARGSEPERVTFRAETSARSIPLRLATDRSALANLPGDEEMFPVANRFRRMLVAGVQRIAPWGDAMRRPSPAGSSGLYRPDASNLPHAIDAMAVADPRALRRLVVARPRGVARRREHHDDQASGRRAPLSGGPLSQRTRSAVLARLGRHATVFSRSRCSPTCRRPGGPYLVEEPENGIHPGNVETLMDSLSSIHDAQDSPGDPLSGRCPPHQDRPVAVLRPRPRERHGRRGRLRPSAPARLARCRGSGPAARKRGPRMKDLVCVVADQHIRATIEELLRRPLSLGIRPIEAELLLHPHHDPGCYARPADLLHGYRQAAEHGLIVLDHAWDGVSGHIRRRTRSAHRGEARPGRYGGLGRPRRHRARTGGVGFRHLAVRPGRARLEGAVARLPQGP